MSPVREAPAPAAPAPLLRRIADRRTQAGIGFDVVLAAVLLTVGVTAWRWPWHAPTPLLLVAAVSVAVRRLSPAMALTLGWLTVLLQVSLGEPPSSVQLASAVVVYTAAAWGNRVELLAAGASAALGGLAAGLYLLDIRFASITLRYGTGPDDRGGSALVVVLLPVVFLGLCWTAGFAVRMLRAGRLESARRTVAEDRAADAQEQAGVEQARAAMARDVHDVVGHSLAVIIAQADSVRFLQDTDRVRSVVDTIAGTARASLLEVRGVLERTERERPVDGTDLDALVAQVRSTGVEVRERTEGEPAALDAASGLAARRVLQEMLTNALRHGQRDAVVTVQRSWRAADLVIEVTNTVGTDVTPGSGAGLTGMRERVAAVGGDLETDRIGDRFVARARIPRAASA